MMAESDVTLYYFPGSFYSLKVLLALLEKKVRFKEHYIYIHGGDQSAPWFLRINKNGEVPVLQIGDRYIAESENILDVIDNTFTSGVRLQPDVETGIGRQVADLRRVIHDIPVDVITFGVLANPSFSVTKTQLPNIFRGKITKERIYSLFTGEVEQYRKQLQTCADDLREPLLAKITKTESRRDSAMDEGVVSKELDALEPIFDQIEGMLRTSGNDPRQNGDVFIAGSELTAADIVVVNLLFRLEMVGVCARFASPEVRPLLFAYYNNMGKRPTVQKIKATFHKAGIVFITRALKRVGVSALKVGAVVGLAALCYIGYKKYIKG